MKKLLKLVPVLSLFTVVAWAADPGPNAGLAPGTEAAAAAAAEDADFELLRAYQREYAFLVAQREALEKQRKALEDNLGRRKNQAQVSVKELETSLARLQVANEELGENLQILEKRRREEQGRSAAAEALWKKARRTLADAEASLAFDPERRSLDLTPPRGISLGDLAELGTQGVKALQLSSGWARFEGAFLDADGRLVDGTIIRLGRVAAFGKNGDTTSVLGPSGNGLLKAVEVDRAGAADALVSGTLGSGTLIPAYFFESLVERAQVKKPLQFLDRVAALAPALFMGMLFFFVVALFGSLARL